MKVNRNGQVFLNGVELEQVYSPTGMLVFHNDKRYFVHNLVAQKYLDGYKPFYTVKHINGDITDNRVENLELYSPSSNLKVLEKGSRWIILEHKKTKERHRFKSLKDASEFLGYRRDYLDMWFYNNKTEQLSWHHEYTIVDIAPKDKRTINRKGKYIKLKCCLQDPRPHNYTSYSRTLQFSVWILRYLSTYCIYLRYNLSVREAL